MTDEAMTDEDIAQAKQHIENMDNERMADSLRLALTEIARLKKAKDDLYERLTSCPCGGTIIGGCSRCG